MEYVRKAKGYVKGEKKEVPVIKSICLSDKISMGKEYSVKDKIYKQLRLYG